MVPLTLRAPMTPPPRRNGAPRTSVCRPKASQGQHEPPQGSPYEVLLLQLRQRFGRLPAAAVARVDKAESTDLDVWIGRVLTASSLDEVLEAKVPVPPSKATSPTRAQPRGARQRTRG